MNPKTPPPIGQAAIFDSGQHQKWIYGGLYIIYIYNWIANPNLWMSSRDGPQDFGAEFEEQIVTKLSIAQATWIPVIVTTWIIVMKYRVMGCII